MTLPLCHVINLKKRPDRRAQFLYLNDGLANFAFVEGIDGDTLSRNDLIDEGVLAGNAQHVTPGALGCALAHRELWLQAIEENQPVIILEDDAVLASDFSRLAPAAMAAAPNADILYFGYNFDQPLAVYAADGLMAVMRFAEEAVADAAWLESFAKRPGVAPTVTTVLRPTVLWGLPAYAVTPAGALKLLSEGFPLRNHDLSLPQGQSISRGIDGSILALIQTGEITAGCCFPPIAISPNNDSDTEGGLKRHPV